MQAGRRFPFVGIAVAVAFAAAGAVPAGADAGAGNNLSVFKVSKPPAELTAGDTFTIDGKVIGYGRPAQRGRVTANITPKAEPGSDATELRGKATTERVSIGEQVRFSFDAEVPADLDVTEPTVFVVRACVEPVNRSGRPRCKKAGRTTISPGFSPGARSLGDELFPQIGNGGYDVGHYEIDLRYDPEANEFLAGTQTTISAMATQNLSEFTLDFQDVPVSSVVVNGEPAGSFAQVDAEPDFSDNPNVTQPMKLVVDPATNIAAADPLEIVVSYAGTPARITDADESFEGWIPACYPLDGPQTCDGAFVVNEPIGAQGWFPNNNFPTDKATFDTSVTVPNGYEAVGIGELVSNGQNGDGTTTWAWSEDDPTSTYLTTATVGRFIYTKRDITETLTPRLLPQYEFIDASATAEEQATINASLARTEEMTNFLAKRFGPYPYDSGGAVADRAAGVGYALEVATRSHYAGNFVTGAPGVGQSTLVHEIAHQWMGNSVTLARWNDIWFQEGWAQWSQWSWNFEDGTSPNSPAGQFNNNYASGPDSKWDTIPTELNNDPADLFATFPTYTRGAMTYEGYRQIVGGRQFFKFARKLQRRFAFDNVSSEDVVDLMLETSRFKGRRLALLEEYFRQWLYESGRPRVTPNDFT